MRSSEYWKDYELIDASQGERLERWGEIILIRPDPQVIWNTERTNPLWRNAHARYHRSNTGGGKWQIYKKIPDSWAVRYRDLTFNVKPMGFKHTGVFPEHAVNWDYAAELIKSSGRKMNVLNLFGYTGCATVSCLKAGAAVCHVDASKGMVIRLSVGSWMTAANLSRAKSAAAENTMRSSWIRRPTAEARPERSGSWRISFIPL